MMDSLRRAWNRSKPFRVVLVATVAFAILRTGIQAAFLGGLIVPPEDGSTGVYIPPDMQVYLDAADHLAHRQPLYLAGRLDQVEFFQYTPAFALAFVPFTWLSPSALVLIHSIFHIAAYAWLFWRWAGLFKRLGLDRAVDAMALTLPVWLLYSSFWADWAYLNIYVIMAVLGTLLLETVLDERLGEAALWLAIILQIKPQWAFAAAVPLLLGRYRFFVRLALLGLAGYAAIAGVTLLAAGPGYVWGQYGEYVRFLAHLAANFPWRGPQAGFQGYNHSVLQTFIYWLGDTPLARQLALAVKVVLTAPLVAVGVRQAAQPADRPGRDLAELSLDLAFALYLAGFLWLDWVWELSLGPVLFVYLLATVERRGAVRWLALVFFPVALLDVWQLITVLAFGQGVVAGAYILTDPSIYVPLILVVIVSFYTVLLRRLLGTPATVLAAPAAGDG